MTQASGFFPHDRSFVSPETFDAFIAIMDRLEVILDLETRALRRHDHASLSEGARQKRQGLLELDRIMRALGGSIPSADIVARLARFREKVAGNQAALAIELEAAAAVTNIITRAIREADSDGTYSRAAGRLAGYDFS